MPYSIGGSGFIVPADPGQFLTSQAYCTDSAAHGIYNFPCNSYVTRKSEQAYPADPNSNAVCSSWTICMRILLWPNLQSSRQALPKQVATN